MFSNVPNKLVTYIFEFLDLKDYRSVLCVSKQFFFIINDHNKFWTRECFRQYISHDLEVYSEIYNSETYRNCIKNKNFALPKSSWKKLLEEGIKHKANFSEALSQIIAKEQADNFLAYFEEILKQPPIPMASLKRETIICNTRTLFQNKLSEVLYENSTCLGQALLFNDEYKATIDELKNREGELLQQMSFDDKGEILKARWYLAGSKDTKETGLEDCVLEMLPELSGLSRSYGFGGDNVNNSTIAIQNQNSLLLRLYYCLVNILTHFCKVISEYLDCVENVYDLLTEYTARWNAYVCTTLELERLFESFTELLNKNYEALFEGYPSYPKFSIWRLMTKIWVSEVFEKSNFKLTLNESFLRILSNHREKNIKQALNINFNFNNTEKYCELPKSLYVGINSKQKKHSSIRYETYGKLNNSPHVCFREVMDLEKQLLSGFVQSILDISLNEVNIHYLNCSDVTATYPYCELEECFLMKSNDFYSDYQNIFHESPDYFCHFLKSDFALFSDIMIERTNFKLSTVQTENGLQFLKNFISEKLTSMSQCDIEKIALQIVPFENQSNNLTLLIENIFQAVIEESAQPQDKAANFYQLPVIDAEDEQCENACGIEALYCQLKNDKNLVKKIMMCFDEADPDFFKNFEFLCQRLEQLEAVKQNDIYIKEDNASKNIPFELGDVDNLFYDINKNIDIQLLDKLYEDYKAFQQQQKNETVENTQGMEEENLEIPALNGFNNMNNFGNNGFNLDIPDDFQDIDLMELPGLSLARRENM